MSEFYFPEELWINVEQVRVGIEKCMEKFKKKNKVIEILFQEHNICPNLTKTVWVTLEKLHPEFFQAYHVRLMLKDQIKQYNHLLEKQIALLQQMKHPHEVLVPNGSHIPSLNDDIKASYYVQETNGIIDNGMKTENMHHLNNGGGLINGYEPIIPWEMQPLPLNMVSGHNMNGVSVAGPTYSFGNPEFVYEGGMESHMPVSSYGIMDSRPYPLMEDDGTLSSQLLLQFSHDVSNYTPEFINTTDNGFPRSTDGPYFPAVDDDDDISRHYTNNYNNGYHNFERDS